MKSVKSGLALAVLSLLIHSASTNPLWAMIKQDGFEEKGNSPSLSHKDPNNNNTSTSLKPLVCKEDEASFKKALQAFKDMRVSYPQLKTLKANKPEIIFIYSWGDKEQENLIHTLASHIKDAGVNVYLDIWHNKAGTEIEKFSGKILEEETDFVVLAGSKNLITKCTSPEYAKLERGSVVKLEVGMVAQRATGPIHTIIPIALEATHKEVFPKFLWNSSSLGFQDRENYCSNCFSLLERVYQLSYDDPHLMKIKEKFKSANISENLKELKNLVQLRITRSKIRSTSPLFVFKLPDESQVSVNSSNEVWVKELNYPNTRWKDYAQRNGLRIKAIVETGDADEVKLSIKRLSRSFFLPGGYEVAVDGGDEVWVKEPSREGYTSPGYYATPFNVFSERVGLIAKPVIRYEN